MTFGWCECVREGTVVFLFLGRTLGRLRLALELVFVELRWEVVVVLWVNEVEGWLEGESRSIKGSVEAIEV